MSIKLFITLIVVSISVLCLSKKENESVFTHALIYRYETLTENGEFWLYHNPDTGSILFKPEDEMIDAVIADTNGTYSFFGDDGHGNKTMTTQLLDWVSDSVFATNAILPISDSLITFEPIAEKRFIHNSEVHQMDIECRGFKMQYHKASGQQNIYFTETFPINAYQIYGFNRLEGAIKLPVVQLDMIGILSEKQLITHIENDIFKLELVAYEYNPYWFDEKKYRQ
ncbi:MAG: hypothetical protein ACSHXF_01375 [Aquaticitalea sp.]